MILIIQDFTSVSERHIIPKCCGYIIFSGGITKSCGLVNEKKTAYPPR
jgi:hypothetical protein